MGKWLKSKLLGKGAFGEVFLANKDDKLIVVKSINCDNFGMVCLMIGENFLKEVNGEPYIVDSFGKDVSEENGERTFNLLLEYAAGGDLHNLLISSPQTDQTRVAYHTRMLLTTLAKIHSLGIVHCDLKPKNILVFPSNVEGQPPKLKIADFGVAIRLSEPSVPDDPDNKFQQRGTLLYSSPKSVAKGEHGTSADIWSLGIIVGEMMDPKYYFIDYADKDQFYDLTVHQPLDVENKVPCHFDHHAVDFLKKCLDKNPANRWSAQHLLNHPFITSR